ncbi:class I SAM-dependent methyltransferase [Paenibacillus bouchesdurhonensis]|uniref:class I SAM-dependent methyltransferase n=1 Tax=Paenibacillus bouchesdurhonensis TaxID=1870990 RepID=UPI000DA63070|nr:class I SAM-dependent methyltransferase [Paenibacillus bouchesdurhonensis]
MAERKYDQSLRIRTVGMREWRNGTVRYHRYEATPYKALDRLFQVYKLNESDKVVDFGCGRGRVSFYIHHRFQIPVTGIEVHEKTYEEALHNKGSYRQQTGHIHAPIRLKYGLAEQYEIKETDNTFYFFNPFSIEIFREVVENILQSVQEKPRTVDIILYYPVAEYKQFLQMHTPFKLINKVTVPGATQKKEKFLIYRLKDNQTG